MHSVTISIVDPISMRTDRSKSHGDTDHPAGVHTRPLATSRVSRVSAQTSLARMLVCFGMSDLEMLRLIIRAEDGFSYFRNRCFL